MGDTEVKNRKVNRSKAAKSEKNGKTKEVINPAVDPRDEVSFETKHVCILSSSSCSLLSTYYYVLTCFKVIPRLNILSTAFVI